jgi:hypothetical protein
MAMGSIANTETTARKFVLQVALHPGGKGSYAGGQRDVLQAADLDKPGNGTLNLIGLDWPAQVGS